MAWLPRPSREAMFWIVLVVLVVFMQWPMLKGTWYKRTGQAAPPSPIAWHADLDTALAEARRSGRPVLVDFAADWCPPCITMKHDVWPRREVAAAVRDGYVPLLIDVDRQPGVASRYEVVGIPTVLVLDADGEILRRTSYRSAAGMKRFLEDEG